MSGEYRNRDCVTMHKGDTFPVEIDDALAATGWMGGQGVNWAPIAGDRFLVTKSDGVCVGFLLKGSEESGNGYTAISANQVFYKFATLCAGGWLICTKAFERYTWASRTGGPPLVENTYTENDSLVFSLNGFWTNEDEWTLAGDPRAPNNFYSGFVVQVPTAANDYYITIQVKL